MLILPKLSQIAFISSLHRLTNKKAQHMVGLFCWSFFGEPKFGCQQRAAMRGDWSSITRSTRIRCTAESMRRRYMRVGAILSAERYCYVTDISLTGLASLSCQHAQFML